MTRFKFTIEDASPLISYSGLWTLGNRESNPDSSDSKNDGDFTATNDVSFPTTNDGSFTATNDSSSKVTFNFVGTGMSIFGAYLGDHDDYSVTLDQSDIDSSGDSGSDIKFASWSSYGLTHEQHTVEATSQRMSEESYFELDYVSIEREIGQDGSNIFHSMIDDTALYVRYDGPWSSDSTRESENYNLTLHSTTMPNSQVEITFQGCCIELYGLYTNAAYSVSLDKQPSMNMQGLDVDLPQNLWRPQTLLYLMDGLSEDTHVVSLTAKDTNQLRPFSFDFALVRSTQNFSTNAKWVAPPVETTTSSSTSWLSNKSAVVATVTINSNSGATDSVNSGLSHNPRTGLAVGLSLGGVVILGLLIAGHLLWRRRRPHPVFNMELLRKPRSRNVPLLTPWKPHSPARSAAPLSDRDSLSLSVITRVQVDEWTATNEEPESTLWGSSSATRGSWDGSMVYLAKYAAQPWKDVGLRGPRFTGRRTNSG